MRYGEHSQRFSQTSTCLSCCVSNCGGLAPKGGIFPASAMLGRVAFFGGSARRSTGRPKICASSWKLNATPEDRASNFFSQTSLCENLRNTHIAVTGHLRKAPS